MPTRSRPTLRPFFRGAVVSLAAVAVFLAACGNGRAEGSSRTSLAATTTTKTAPKPATTTTKAAPKPATTTTKAAPKATTTTRPKPTTTITTTTTTRPANDPDGIPYIEPSQLPAEAREALQLIDAGGPFPFSRDGIVFQNREKLLPTKSSGYYHEYTVITPGSSDRGARRIITGRDGQRYYTSDHYASFRRVRL